MLCFVGTGFDKFAPIVLYIISVYNVCTSPYACNNRSSPPQDSTSPQIPPFQSLNVTNDTIEEDSHLAVEEDGVRERVESPPPYCNNEFYQDVTEDLPPTYERALIMPYSMHYASNL